MIKIVLLVLVATTVISNELGYDQDKAKLLFTLSVASSCTQAIQPLKAWGFSQLENAKVEKAQAFDDTKLNLMFYFAKVRKTGVPQPIIALIFRGSLPFGQSLCTNWLQLNLNVDQVPLQFSKDIVIGQKDGVLVHQGFRDAYNKIRDNVFKEYQRFIKGEGAHQLWITGHSLGGALSTLATIDFASVRGIKIDQFYTTGSPRIGNKQFAKFFNAQFPNKFRVVRMFDPVTVLPFESALALALNCTHDFKHSGKMVLYNDTFTEHQVCKDQNLINVNLCATKQYNQMRIYFNITAHHFIPDIPTLTSSMENHLEYFNINFRSEFCPCLQRGKKAIPDKCHSFLPVTSQEL